MQTAAALKVDPVNQRQHTRFDFKLEVSANTGHQFFTGFTENISTGGLFVQTYQTMPLGSVLSMAMRIPGLDREFQLECEVRWVREYSEMTPHMLPGMGVRFINLAPEDELLLNAALSQMQTMFYDDEDEFSF